MLQKLKDFVAGLTEEETPAVTATATQPAAPAPDPTPSGGATPAASTPTASVPPPAESPATGTSTTETPPIATAAETIIPPAGVTDPAKTTGGTVFDRLDRGEKVSSKEINDAWDDPNSDLKARLMKSGR